MRVILNYKSLYEAVKVGVTNDGYTPVTRMLFFPVFDPKGDIQPCDENGVPYAVDTKNANAWCKGEDNIPVNIKTAVGKKSTLEALIKYYKSKAFTDNLYEATEDEMYEAVVALVKDCEDVSDTAKKALLKVYNSGEKLEFLARVFQRAVRGENKVVSKSRKKKAADTDADSVTEFNTLVRKKKPRVKVPKKVQPPELNYVTQLYLAYKSATGKTVTKPEDLDPLDYREHFEHQRKTFYMAETVHSEIRDSVMPNEPDPFDELKEEIDTGIFEVKRASYKNAVLKIDAVVGKAAELSISSMVDDATNHWKTCGKTCGDGPFVSVPLFMPVEKQGDRHKRTVSMTFPGDFHTGYQLKVVNDAGVKLPGTGGPGTRFFTILDSILLIGTGVLLWRRRRMIR